MSTITPPIRRPKHWQFQMQENVRQQELSFAADGSVKWYSHFERQFGGFLQTKYTSNHDPAIVLFSIYPKELKS